MPTLQVNPSAHELLQAVADVLGKARKVVVITGAGISTNSGIPDFRSQNGLYSLIQSQYDKAQTSALVQDEDADFEASGRPPKRRRISQDQGTQDSDDEESASDACDTEMAQELPSLPQLAPSLPGNTGAEEACTQSDNPTSKQHARVRVTRSQASSRPDLPRQVTDHSNQSATTQGSLFSNPGLSTTSSQTDELASPTDDEDNSISCVPYRTPKKSQIAAIFSSSPLSSPPPILWDPYENVLPSTDASSQFASDSSDDSDAENAEHSVDFFSASQGSSTRLRTMKGRDLFDSNIWADPVKTSVFYRFATSLRQKVKDIEPTDTHRFIAQLRDVGKLARVYTQNIDEIEKKLGLSTDLKHGAGSKRRRSAKVQPQPAEDGNDEAQHNSSENLPENRDGNHENGICNQESKDADKVEPKPTRSTAAPDRGVECVFLHGSLSSLRCFLCGKMADWDEDGREGCTLSGEQPECPHCAGAAAARVEKGRRALGVGKLRPDIVLYGEEHPQSDLISPIVQHDLSSGPDVLLILGTSLRVHGLKIMVKEFAKSVHSKGGKVVFVNFTKPSESVWGDVLDYWVEWDCDAWVNDLKERKPNLWLSAEDIQEQDRQRRETLAEKKRESLLRRESTMERKRESISDKQRSSLDHNRVPAKNPQSMRNDMQCGAYVVWDIMQSLAKVGDRPFDNLASPVEAPARMKETPVPPPSLPDFVLNTQAQNVALAAAIKTSAKADSGTQSTPDPPPQVLKVDQTVSQDIKKAPGRAKRPRKSASAVLKESSNAKEAVDVKAFTPQSQSSSVTKFKEAAGRLPRASDADHIARLNILSQPPTPTPPRENFASPPPPPTSPPAEDISSASIGAAVKSNPRQRKPKVRYDPTPVKEIRTAGKRVLPPPIPTQHSQVASEQPQQQEGLPMFESRIFLPPIVVGDARPAPYLEVKLQLSPLHCPARNVRPAPYVIPEGRFPMRFSDPLGKLGYNTGFPERTAAAESVNKGESIAKHDSRHDASAQLLREEEEAAQTLAWMQGIASH